MSANVGQETEREAKWAQRIGVPQPFVEPRVQACMALADAEVAAAVAAVRADLATEIEALPLVDSAWDMRAAAAAIVRGSS